jgi:hypothetical protein
MLCSADMGGKGVRGDDRQKKTALDLKIDY